MRAWIRRFWTARTPTAHGVLLVGGGMLAGAIGWGAFEVVDARNPPLPGLVQQEHELSPRPAHPTGARAACLDCHSPHAMARGVQAIDDEPPLRASGSFDTAQALEDHRQAMARHRWAAMKADQARQCRGCHARATATPEPQQAREAVTTAPTR